jgi:hypothetical protein
MYCGTDNEMFVTHFFSSYFCNTCQCFLQLHRSYLDGWAEYLVVWYAKRPTNAEGSGGYFIINTIQILPRHVSAYGCHPQGVVSAL